MNDEHSENGGYPVNQRNGYVGHRYAGEFRYEQSDNEFERLHFADLSFSHKAHNDEKNDKSQRRTNKNYYHKKSISKRLQIMWIPIDLTFSLW